MKKILIIVCSGTTNRGTEALVRGTISLLEKAFGNNIEVTLASSTPELDKKQNLPFVKKNILRTLPQKYNLFIRVIRKIGKLVNLISPYDFSYVIDCAKKSDLVLEVGADNYDVAYNLYPSLHQLNKKLRKNTKGKLFLYDCSLNKESVNEQFINELKLFDAVSVREIQTYENILEICPTAKLHFIPDPAFVMNPSNVLLPDFWENGNMIGINLSTLIVGSAYGDNLKEKVLQSYEFMIDNLLLKTRMKVVLVPHVMKRADLEILEEIKNLYKDNLRVCLISNEDYSAPELKYIISSCRFFVGARTHATIAAYSSCVPTLVLGYSTKSIGIARDLFGTDKGYVVPVQELTNKEILWQKLADIIENELAIKSRLEEVIPDYQYKTYEMSNVFKELLGV